MNRLAIFIFCTLWASITSCSHVSKEPATALSDSIIDSTSTPIPTELSIMMMGDIMPGTQHPFNNSNFYLTKDDGKSLFDNVKPIIANGDFIVGNLEGTLIDRSAYNDRFVNTFSYCNFMIPTRYSQLFKDAGFTALAVINNHANDFCNPGIESTRKTLNEIGMPYSGFKADGGYTIIEKEGVVYALCAFGASPNGNHIDNIDEAKKIIAEADSIANIVVVSFHGGNEGMGARHVPRRREVFNNGISRGDVYKFAHASIDAGADVVFGVTR